MTTTDKTIDRDEAIARIRTALKRRSGKAWSVTGGRGTAWGWITVEAPPARRTKHRERIGTKARVLPLAPIRAGAVSRR